MNSYPEHILGKQLPENLEHLKICFCQHLFLSGKKANNIIMSGKFYNKCIEEAREFTGFNTTKIKRLFDANVVIDPHPHALEFHFLG